MEPAHDGEALPPVMSHPVIEMVESSGRYDVAAAGGEGGKDPPVPISIAKFNSSNSSNVRGPTPTNISKYSSNTSGFPFLSKGVTAQDRESARNLRRRSLHTITQAHAEPPSLFDYQPDTTHRSRYSLKDIAEAYFRSTTAQLIMLWLSLISCLLFVIETYYEAWGVDNITLTVSPSSVQSSFPS